MAQSVPSSMFEGGVHPAHMVYSGMHPGQHHPAYIHSQLPDYGHGGMEDYGSSASFMEPMPGSHPRAVAPYPEADDSGMDPSTMVSLSGSSLADTLNAISNAVAGPDPSRSYQYRIAAGPALHHPVYPYHYPPPHHDLPGPPTYAPEPPQKPVSTALPSSSAASSSSASRAPPMGVHRPGHPPPQRPSKPSAPRSPKSIGSNPSSAKGPDTSCPHCGKQLASLRSLSRHVKTVHEKVRAFVCDQCDARFTEAGSRDRHIRTVHQNLREYRCEHCGKQFSEAGNRDRHVRTVHKERGDRVFACAYCGLPFRSARERNAHMKEAHGGIRDFACSVCNSPFPSAKARDMHVEKYHPGVTPQLPSSNGAPPPSGGMAWRPSSNSPSISAAPGVGDPPRVELGEELYKGSTDPMDAVAVAAAAAVVSVPRSLTPSMQDVASAAMAAEMTLQLGDSTFADDEDRPASKGVPSSSGEMESDVASGHDPLGAGVIGLSDVLGELVRAHGDGNSEFML
jgi:transcription elongation factor Elf1